MRKKSYWMLLLLAVPLGAFSACQNENIAQKKTGTTNTFRRKEIDLSQLVLPKGFPDGVSVYKVVWLGDQYDEELDENNEQYGNVTWDTSATVTEVRDFYAKEFESRQLNPHVSKLTDIQGENYLVRFLDKERKKIFAFSCGQRTKGGTVKCFITSRTVSQEQIKEYEKETAK